MARDFAETGAIGAGYDSDGAGPAAGSFGSGDALSNAWSSSGVAQPSASGRAPSYAPSASDNGGGGGGGYSPLTMPPTNNIQDTTGVNPWSRQFLQNTGGMTRMSFSEGGAIDEDPNAMDPMGSGMGAQLQAQINAALGVVDSALSYGRKLHGLGGNEDEGAIKDAPQQTAQRMQTVPGNQSESGAPRPQPMPGPLPPTSNPFGKRAEAAPEEEQDDQSGAIPMDEETA